MVMQLTKLPHFGRLRQRLLSRFKLLRPQLAAREIREVLAYYDLGQWRTVQALEGRNSCNVVLETSAGKKLLKRYYGSPESTIVEHFVINHLAALDFPCSKLEINNKGQTYLRIDDKYYAIYNYIEGNSWLNSRKDLRIRERLLKSAAHTLAQLDAAMNTIKTEDFPDETYLSGREWSEQLEEDLCLVDQYVEMVCRLSKRRNEQDALINVSREIRNGITEAWHYYQQIAPDFPKQVVHYDYAPKNLIFGSDRVVAVLDFGEARFDFRASDVVRGLTSFAGGMGRDMDSHKAAIFLQAYNSKLTLHKKEIESLSDLMRWRILRSILRIMQISLKTENQADKVGFYRDPENYILRKWQYVRELKEQNAEIKRFLVKVGSN